MKLNIQKLQSGGGFGVLFSAVADPSSNATQTQTSGTSSSSSSKNEDSGILSKEVLNKLRLNGLPNEVDVFEDILAQLDQKIASGKPINYREIAEVRKMANRIIKQSDYLDKAIDFADKNESLNDIAVDSRGYIYAIDESGKVEKVRFNQFNTNKHQALTYGELAEYRRNSPDLINNSDIITSIGNSVGIEKINQFIQEILDKVGNSESKQEAFQSLKTLLGKDINQMSAQEYDSLSKLAQASDQIGLDSIFKTTEFSKNSNVAIAAQYIMSILPKDMRSELQGTYIAQGGSYKDSQSYAQALVGMASEAAANRSYHYGIDYQADINKAAGNSQESKPKQRNITGIEQLINGSNSPMDVIFRDSKNSNSEITFHGSGMGQLPGLDGHPVGKTIASLALQQSIGSMIDTNHMTMGSQKIYEGDLESILYNGGDVIKIWAPVDQNGDVDINAYLTFNQLMDQFNKSDMGIEQKNAILREYGLDGYINESGTFVGQGNMQQFIVFTGITSDEIIDTDDSQLIEILSGNIKDSEKNQIERIYSGINKNLKEGNFEFKTGLFSTNYIKAPVFLKVKPTAQIDASIFTGNGAMVTTPTYQDQIIRNNMRYQADLAGKIYTPSAGYLAQ